MYKKNSFSCKIQEINHSFRFWSKAEKKKCRQAKKKLYFAEKVGINSDQRWPSFKLKKNVKVYKIVKKKRSKDKILIKNCKTDVLDCQIY